ncbi:MAG: acyl-CoA thioesterase [Treponema sp.]|jgi:acyl-CoA thioester hydrolase|nr:acyl-CoA thioesterase [Treponema sp.]
MEKDSGENVPAGLWSEAEISVEFFDLDPMRVVWHGNYINYFEAARRKLLEKIGYGYYEMEESGYAFPVVEISAKYPASLKHGDRARITATLVEYENRLKIKYEIRNAETGVLTTKGTSTQMAYNLKTGESCFVCPKELTEKVEALAERELKSRRTQDSGGVT